MTSVNSKTSKPLLAAAASPLAGARNGTSRGRFAQRAYTQPVIKQIPSLALHIKNSVPLSAAAKESEGFISDFSWIFRTAAIETFPSSPLSIVADNAMGAPTMSNFIRGLSGIYGAKEKLKRAHAINDREGANDARLNLVASTMQTAFGATYIGIRTTSIASAWITASKAFNAARKALGWIGSIIFIPFNFMFGVWSTQQWYRAHRFHSEFEAQGKTFQSLIGMIYVSPDAIAQMILDQTPNLRLSGALALEEASKSKEAAEHLAVLYRQLPKDEKGQSLDFVLKAFAAEHPNLQALKEFYFSELDAETVVSLELPTAVGLLLHLEKMQQTNEARAAHALGSTCLEKIKKATARGLEARCSAFIPESIRQRALAERTRILNEVELNYAQNQKTRVWSIAVGVGGVILGTLGVIAFFASGPVGPAILLALTLIYASLCLYEDILELQDAFNGQPGTYDKLFIKIEAFMTVLGMFAAGIAFAYFGGLPVLVLALALGAVMLALYYYTHRKMVAQEKKWKEDHPSIEVLQRRLSQVALNEPLSADMVALFKNLPKNDRRAIMDAAQILPSLRYARWDLTDQFGQSCLESYLNGEGFAQSEIENLRRAVKKTAKFFWTQWWYSNKNEYFKSQALKLEELLHSIGNTAQAKTAYSAIDLSDIDLRRNLYDSIERVFKREESVGFLSRAILTAKEIRKSQVQKLSA